MSTGEKLSQDRVTFMEALVRAMGEAGPVVEQFAEHVLPKMLEHFALRPAKGGSEERYKALPDQSMFSHVLNGILPALRVLQLAQETPAQGESLKPVDPLKPDEESLVLLAFTLHDVDKLEGWRPEDLNSWTEERRLNAFRQAVADWAGRLNADAFWPDWSSYLNDIVWLVLNCQEAWGTDLRPGALPGKLPAARRHALRSICTFADVSASAATSPREAATHRKLRNLLGEISGGRLQWAHHQLAEVRGLLSAVINNGAMKVFRDHGWHPLLFYPNGVAYVGTRHAPMPSLDELATEVVKTVLERARKQAAQSIKFNPSPQQIRYAKIWREFLSPADVISSLAEHIASVVQDNRTRPSDLLAKIASLKGSALPPSLPTENLPSDERVDRLAEFLAFLDKEARELGCGTSVKDAVMDHLGAHCWAKDFEQVSALPGTVTGGVPMAWYYFAARYVQAHPDLSVQEIPDLLLRLAKTVDTAMSAWPETGWVREALQQYAPRVLEGLTSGPTMLFANELKLYEAAKRLKAPLTACSLCSSSANGTEISAAEASFGGDIFSQRRVLWKLPKTRGICPICRIELMLRQGALEGSTDLAAYLWLYPTYYFTIETGRWINCLHAHQLSYSDVLRNMGTDRSLPALSAAAQAIFSIRKEMLQGYLSRKKSAEKVPQQKLLSRIVYPAGQDPTVILWGLPAGRATDTEVAVSAALYALLMSLSLGVKVVASPSAVPIFSAGDEFHETVILDGSQDFLRHLLGDTRARIDRVEDALRRLVCVLILAQRARGKWDAVRGIAHLVATDPLYVFRIGEQALRRGKSDLHPKQALEMCQIYLDLRGEESMGVVGELAEKAYEFYRPRRWTTHAIVLPLSVAGRALVETKASDEADVKAAIAGILMEAIERQRERAWVPVGPREVCTKSGEFVDILYDKVFLGECRGDRALLRRRLATLRSAYHYYYVAYLSKKAKDSKEDQENAE